MNAKLVRLLRKFTGHAQSVRIAVSIPGASEPAVHTLQYPSALVGRAATADIQLEHHEVSYRHAYLQPLAGGVFCVDLRSRTGTRWEEGRRRAGWLIPNQPVQIGPYAVRWVREQTEQTAVPAFDPLRDYHEQLGPFPEVELEFLNASKRSPVWTVNRTMTLMGSSSLCKLRFEAERVSRVHCSLLHAPDGLWVIDLMGRRGTSVNGERIRIARLEEDDVLRIGPFRLAVHYASNVLEFEARGDSSAGDAESSWPSTVLPDSGSESEQSASDLVGSLLQSDALRKEPAAIATGMTCAQFLDAAIESGLISQQQIDDVSYNHSVNDLPELKRALVENDLVTGWQTDQIAAGNGGLLVLEDRFQLKERLGGGSMGTVFRAYDRRLHQDVAIKVPRAKTLRTPRLLKRFRREAMINGQLDHRHIVRALDIGADGSYIVLEYVPGKNLKVLLHESGPLPVEEAVDYAEQICEALGFANQQGVIHRDVKSSNILITPDGEAKLLDLGLARVRGSDEQASPKAEEQLTRAGIQLGTVRYMAPEQAEDSRRADTRADIYGLGCTLYETLCGSVPFEDDNPVKILLGHATEPVPPIPGLDEGLATILNRALAKDPNERFQTPQEFGAALHHWRQMDQKEQQIRELNAQLETHLQEQQQRIEEQEHRLLEALEVLDISEAERHDVLRIVFSGKAPPKPAEAE